MYGGTTYSSSYGWMGERDMLRLSGELYYCVVEGIEIVGCLAFKKKRWK